MLGMKKNWNWGCFSLHMPHMVPFSSHKGLILAPCTHHALLQAFMTNAAAISASYWSVSLKIGCAQNFCASLSRDSRQSLAGRCSRRAGITSCLNLSANQQSNVMFFFLLIFLTHRSRSPKADLSRWESPHRALQCLTYVLDLSAETVYTC